MIRGALVLFSLLLLLGTATAVLAASVTYQVGGTPSGRIRTGSKIIGVVDMVCQVASPTVSGTGYVYVLSNCQDYTSLLHNPQGIGSLSGSLDGTNALSLTIPGAPTEGGSAGTLQLASRLPAGISRVELSGESRPVAGTTDYHFDGTLTTYIPDPSLVAAPGAMVPLQQVTVASQSALVGCLSSVVGRMSK